MKVLVNTKKYFRTGYVVQPYVGDGPGFVVADLSGDIYGSATGLTVLAMGEVEFRWERLGLHAELMLQKADPGDVDVSDTRLLVGMSYQFCAGALGSATGSSRVMTSPNARRISRMLR